MPLFGRERETAMSRARMLYIQGETLAAISRTLDVPETTMARWKAAGEWDRVRQEARDVTVRVRLLFEEQLSYLEAKEPKDRDKAQMEALGKLGSLLASLEKAARDRRRENESDESKPPASAGLSDEAAGDIRERILGVRE